MYCRASIRWEVETVKHFNFILILVTVMILATIGILFIIGTVYSSVQAANWTETSGYQDYLVKMNMGVLPFVIALLVVLGLCIPKRLFSGMTLLKVNGTLLAATLLIAGVSGAKVGLGFLLLTAAALQMAVIGLTLAGSKRLSFERAGFFLQIGSAFLHLGLVIFLFDFMLLADSASHLFVFWTATALIGLGMTSSFYSQELSLVIRRPEAGSRIVPAEETSS